MLKELAESKQERDSVLSLKDIEIKEAVEAKEVLMRTKEELVLSLPTADEKASHTIMERDKEMTKSESLLDERKSPELSLDKVTTERNDLMESKSKLTSQIVMISLHMNRALCKSEKL